MKVMKLLIVLAFVLFTNSAVRAESAYYKGDGGKGKVVLLDDVVMVNAMKGDAWLSQSVKTDVLSDLSQYSAIKVLESEQQKNVLKLQKESESAIYDDTDMIELGRMVKAREYIKITITRIEQKGQSLYSLQATVVNIESGTSEGGFNPKTYYSKDEFLTKAHGELSAGVLEELGVELTETGKRLIAKASEVRATAGTAVKAQNIAVVSAKELKDAQDNLNAIDSELERMKEKLLQIENSDAFDLEKQAEKMRLENQRATLEQQQKAEKEHIERMKADAARRAKEAEESKKRSAEQQQKIDEIASEIEAKSAEILKKASRNSVEEQVVTLEKQKAVYAANQRRINDSIASAQAGIEAERLNAIKERKAEKPRKADLNADGSLSENGQRALEDALSSIDKKYADMKAESEKKITADFADVQTPLWSTILSDKDAIAKGKYTASTLDGKVLLSVKDYDGTAQGWAYDIAMTFNGVTVYKASGTLTYDDITGKGLPQYPEKSDKKYDEKVKAYNAFQDDIEFFDSFFRTGVPFITANISYKIAAAPFNRPSEYDITIEKLTFNNLQLGKDTKSVKIGEDAVYRYVPVTFIDWRSDKEKASDIKKTEKHRKSLLKKAEGKISMGRSLNGWVSTAIAVVGVVLGLIIFFGGGGWLGCLGTLIVFGLIMGGVQKCGQNMSAKGSQMSDAVSYQKALEKYQWKTYERLGGKETISFLEGGKAQFYNGRESLDCTYSVGGGLNITMGEEYLSFSNRAEDVLLLEGNDGATFSAVYFDCENAIAEGNEEYVAGMTFAGKWSEQYDAKITFGKDGKASVKFSDGDKAEGEYMLNRSGSIILYNHRNKGKWYSFKTEKNADGVYSITLISPKVPDGYNWQQQP